MTTADTPAVTAFAWPASCRRIWDDSAFKIGRSQTLLFRRKFELPADRADRAVLHVYAEGRFIVSVNGTKVARGPWLHRPFRRAVTTIDVSQHLWGGTNVLAILAHHPGASFQNTVISGEPGPVCNLELAYGTASVGISSDSSWRFSPCGWNAGVHRRGWALGTIECFDGSAFPYGWEEPGFDDTAWEKARAFSPSSFSSVTWIAPELPLLRFAPHEVPQCNAIYHGDSTSPPLEDDPVRWSGFIEQEEWREAECPAWSERAMPMQWDADPGRGRIVYLDLDNLYTGHFHFEIECQSAGRIEILWSERMKGRKPWVALKGTVYADCFDVSPGIHKKPSVYYSAFRYIALVFRGFAGKVVLKNVTIEETYLDTGLDRLDLALPDTDLNRIWEISRRTLHCGPQDGMTDCPSREQAVYVSDSPLTAFWLFHATGDRRLLAHTLSEIFLEEQDGLVRDCVYSRQFRSFVDFNLLAVILLGRYAGYPNTTVLIAAAAPRAESILLRMERMRSANGLIEIDWALENKKPVGLEEIWTGQPPKPLEPYLFLDHPGMGWHNLNDPPLDRSGTNICS
jgi:hypothetical protein